MALAHLKLGGIHGRVGVEALLKHCEALRALGEVVGRERCGLLLPLAHAQFFGLQVSNRLEAQHAFVHDAHWPFMHDAHWPFMHDARWPFMHDAHCRCSLRSLAAYWLLRLLGPVLPCSLLIRRGA